MLQGRSSNVLIIGALAVMLLNGAMAQGSDNGAAASKLVCPTCTGYYWYIDPSRNEEKESDKKKNDELDMPQPVIPPPLFEKFTNEDLMKMHPDQIQHLVTLYLKKAVGTPSSENVRDYYSIQNIARIKAAAFTNVADYIVQTNPQLSVAGDYPIVTPGRDSLKRQSIEEVRERLISARDDYALLYFFSPTCEYCKLQDEINSYFIVQYGWEIKGINVMEQRDLASRFHVTMTPFIVLIERGSDKTIPITVGVVSVDEMATRIYRGIRLLSGKITPEQWTLMEFQRGGAFDVNNVGGE